MKYYKRILSNNNYHIVKVDWNIDDPDAYWYWHVFEDNRCSRWVKSGWRDHYFSKHFNAHVEITKQEAFMELL